MRKNFNRLLIIIVVFILIGLPILLGSCGAYIEPPGIEEAPYKILWKEGTTSRSIYTDNYKLGSSVVVEGYWEYKRSYGFNSYPVGWFYKNNLLILDANSIVIEER